MGQQEKHQAAQGQNNNHKGEDNKQCEEYAAEMSSADSMEITDQ